jgi:hypothetical protein
MLSAVRSSAKFNILHKNYNIHNRKRMDYIAYCEAGFPFAWLDRLMRKVVLFHKALQLHNTIPNLM